MKTVFTILLSICTLPALLSAQPLLTTNEYYHVGDVISMSVCDAATVSAGASGANVTWDFSSVSSSGGASVTKVFADTSSVFLTANIMMLLPNGDRQHIKENSTDSYLEGLEYATSPNVVHYNFYDIARRPMTYGTNYHDSFNVDIALTGTTGTGHLWQTGDAYGTLMLPTGTFNNVMRVKKYQIESDTTGSAIINSTVTSYLWFDTAHAAPLFRLDSFSSVTGITQSAMYLSAPVSVRNLHAAQENEFSGYFVNNDLWLKGSFVTNTQYEVEVLNLIGTRIYKGSFVATGSDYRIETNRSLAPGIYLIGITQHTPEVDRTIIKVVKN